MQRYENLNSLQRDQILLWLVLLPAIFVTASRSPQKTSKRRNQFTNVCQEHGVAVQRSGRSCLTGLICGWSQLIALTCSLYQVTADWNSANLIRSLIHKFRFCKEFENGVKKRIISPSFAPDIFEGKSLERRISEENWCINKSKSLDWFILSTNPQLELQKIHFNVFSFNCFTLSAAS